jgi:hypothetical protein
MCRSIKTLFNYDPPVTDEEIYASSLQYVRKVSGYRKPSKVNQVAFDRAVEDVALITRQLMDSLVTNAPHRDREQEAAKARARAELARARSVDRSA